MGAKCPRGARWEARLWPVQNAISSKVWMCVISLSILSAYISSCQSRLLFNIFHFPCFENEDWGRCCGIMRISWTWKCYHFNCIVRKRSWTRQQKEFFQECERLPTKYYRTIEKCYRVIWTARKFVLSRNRDGCNSESSHARFSAVCGSTHATARNSIHVPWNNLRPAYDINTCIIVLRV